MYTILHVYESGIGNYSVTTPISKRTYVRASQAFFEHVAKQAPAAVDAAHEAALSFPWCAYITCFTNILQLVYIRPARISACGHPLVCSSQQLAVLCSPSM